MNNNYEFYEGYAAGFLNTAVALPALDFYQKDLVEDLETGSTVINYVNYSLVLSKSRRFPIFTASNIDGLTFKKAPRKDNWRKDGRVDKGFQWGPELYRVDKSDFDKGHMTKREDVQWGDSIAIASLAADSTFYYTNAVPQHAKLNQKVWRSLEDYILHTETTANSIKICVFTGPVLLESDPRFVTEVQGEFIQLPTLFWKIVYFEKPNKGLSRVAFLMSQYSLLEKYGIIDTHLELESLVEEDELFLKFKGAETYQVNVGTIEKLTGLKFTQANEPFTDDRQIKLVLEEIDVKESFKESAIIENYLGFSINGLLI